MMKITVTQEDIDAAEIARAANESRGATCPIALAAQRDWHEDARIGYGMMWKRGRYWATQVLLPIVVSEFVRKFDDDQLVKPFSFDILER